MPYADPERRRKYQRRWYLKNQKRRQAEISARNREQYAKVQAFLMEERSKGCERCGFKHPAAIDFHHTSEKVLPLGAVARAGWGLNRVKNEVAKCIRLCANCHRIEHYNQRVS